MLKNGTPPPGAKCPIFLYLSLFERHHGVGDGHGGHQDRIQEGRCPDVAGLFIQIAGDDGRDRQGRNHGDQDDTGKGRARMGRNAGGEQGDVLAGQPDDRTARIQGDGNQIA